MNPNADRGNRLLLTLLALLLLAAGGLGLALGYGAFGSARARQPVLLPAVQQFLQRNADWFWPVLAVVAVLLGLLALRWLLAQLGTDRIHDLSLERDTRTGSTTVHTSAVTDALTEEVEGYRGVQRSAARLVGDEVDPELVLAVTVDERTELGALRRRIEEQAVGHTRTALGMPGLPVQLQLRLAAPKGRTPLR